MIDELILDLYNKGCIKFGQFKLKSGEMSPIYIDLKEVISYNFILQKIIDLLYEKIKYIDTDLICGVPYGAIVFTSILGFKYNYKQILLRKELKAYGTKKMIEGTFKENDSCILIEDTITSGQSILKYIDILDKNKIKVENIFVICDRRLKSNKKLDKYNIRSLFTIYDIFRCFRKYSLIEEKSFKSLLEYFKTNKLMIDNISFCNSRKPLENRLRITNIHPLTKKIIEIMIRKKTNLCFSADVTNIKDLIRIVGKIGKHICILKIHYDIIEDFNYKCGQSLKKLSESLDFVIFEDRKYNDIGNTFKNQYLNNSIKVNNWAHLISVLSFSFGIYDNFNNIYNGNSDNKGIISISDMSNKSNTCNLLEDCNKEYNNYKLKNIIEKYNNVCGIVTQKRVLEDDSILYLTPGVQLKSFNNEDQKYRDVQSAIISDNCDIIIVGRGIINSDNIDKQAELYKMLGWTSYMKKIA